LWLVGLLLVGAYAAAFVPGLAGQRPSGQAGMAALVWSALFFGLLWKRRAQNTWQGIVIGIVVGFFVFMAGHFAAGVVS
jgi:hypothetical protein